MDTASIALRAATYAGVAAEPIATHEGVGMTVEQLATMFSFVRSANYHSKPPSASAAGQPARAHAGHSGSSGGSGGSSALDRDRFSLTCVAPREGREEAVAPLHMGLFFRAFADPRPQLQGDVLQELFHFCLSNEPEWVHRVQTLARTILLDMLRHRGDPSHALRTLGPQLATATTPPSADDVPGLQLLRGALPIVNAPTPPDFTVSTTTFRFMVDLDAPDDADRYFSAQVKISNEDKSPLSLRVAQQLTVIDGRARTLGAQSDLDLQLILERSQIKRGESARLLISLIAKPHAAFSAAQCFIVLVVQECIKVVVSFTVVNPWTAPFGTAIPCCVTQPVLESPIGAYEAPILLQVLKHRFQQVGGFGSAEVAHLLAPSARPHHVTNTATMAEVAALRTVLDEEATSARLLPLLWRHTANGSRMTGAAYGVPGSPTDAGAVAGLRQRFAVPASTAQPQGYVPAGIVPASSQKKLVTSAGGTGYLDLPALRAASPQAIFGLILTWFAEFPTPIIDRSLVLCDPHVYLDTLQPHLQHLVAWLVDLWCGLLMHEDTGITARGIALTFGPILCARSRAVDHDTYAASLANLRDRQEEAINNRNALDAVGASGGAMAEASSPAADALVSDMHLQLHAGTAIVHWIKRYRQLYTRNTSRVQV